MPHTLALDTATASPTMTLAEGADMIATAPLRMGRQVGDVLVQDIRDFITTHAVRFDSISRYVVARGPGGFTGIRMGLATVQGLALATGAAVLGYTSLEAVAATAPPGQAVLALVDSRRSEPFYQLFDAAHHPLTDPAQGLPEQICEALASYHQPFTRCGDAVAGLDSPYLQTTDENPAQNSGQKPASYGLIICAQTRAPQPPLPLYIRPPDVTIKTA